MLIVLVPVIMLAQVEHTPETILEETSVSISKTNSSKSFKINSGDKIKLWTVTKQVNGQFQAAGDGKISVVSQGRTVVVDMAQIYKVRIYSRPSVRVAGVATMLVGAAGMAFGTLSTVVGTIGLLKGDWGGVVIIFAPVLPAGYGIMKLGERFYGKTLSMKTGWKFS